MFQRHLLLCVFFLIALFELEAQCFQVADGNGVMSNNPYFVSCTPGTYTVFIQTDQTIGPYTIDWGDGSPNASGASLVPPAIEQHTYAATTDTFNVVITNSADGCVVNGVVVMERNPLASIQLPAGDDNFGCTPIQFRFVNSSTQISQTTTFTWDFGDGTPVETYDYTNLGDTVYHTYMPGVGVQSCNLEVRLTATNYCGSSTASFFPLRVWDLDEAVITPSATLLCYPDTTVNYTNNTVRNCFPEGNQSQRYEYWNFGDYWGLGYDSIIGWRPWNPPIINPPPIAYPGIGTYTVMLIDSSFCGRDTSFETITITSPPTAGVSLSRDTICEGESIQIFNNSMGAANRFYWDYDKGGGFVQRNGNTKTVTYNNSGDYTIQLAIGVAGAGSCVDTASVDLYVNPAPTAAFTFNPDNQCDSATVSFTNTSTGTIVRWNWDFDNGNTFSGTNPPSQFYGTAGTYDVKLVTENDQGCLDSITQQVRIRETPVADFSVNSVCLNQVAQFNDLSTASIDAITSWKWYFGDGDSSSAQNPTHLYTAFGNYQVILIVDNGFCQDSDTLDVTVEANPTAAFTPDVDNGCSRLTVNFTNASSVNATTFTWDFGDGSPQVVARDTNHTYTNGGINDTSFVVRMIAQTAFGCADTTYDTITVFPVPVPSFTSDAVVDCGPVTVNFTNSTQGDSLNFFWNFGDGSPVVSDTNPTHVFSNTTLFISNYSVSLVVVSNGGCRDTTTQTVTIYPEPQFAFQAVPDSGCSPLAVTFPSVVGAVDYNWDFGDGNTGTGASPTHTYINTTTNDLIYTVRLIAQNGFGCFDTTYGNVTVYPSPTAQFSLDTNVGCQPFPVQIINSSTGANSFDWTFGDGSTSDTSAAVFTQTYANTSAITQFNTIELITSTDKGCLDTATANVQVHPFVQAGFISDSVGCSPTSINFLNTSIGASLFRWTFGDGDTSISSNASHIYQHDSLSIQNYTAKLVVQSPQACQDSASRSIVIYPKPIADFSLSDTLGCQPLTVDIVNNSSIADSCFWSYGDGNTFDQCAINSQHTYTNTTSFFPIRNTLSLFVFTDNGCRDTLRKTVEVNPQVIANFNSIDSGCSPLTVNYQNLSVGGQNYNWNFGDGSNSFNTNPNRILTNPSDNDTIYNTKLVVTSQQQCQDSIEIPIKIFAKPRAILTLDTNRGCHPHPVQFTNSSVNADSCRWVFGDGVVNDTCFINYTKVYQNITSSSDISYNTRLFVFSRKGCLDTTNQVITVNPNIEADFSSIDQGCHPLAVSFTNLSTPNVNSAWTFGDGGLSNTTSPGHTFINNSDTTAEFITQLLVTNSFGCQDSINDTIHVFPKPKINLTLDTNRGCHPHTVNYTNASINADSCRWVFGDGIVEDSCFVNYTKVYQNTTSSSAISYNTRLFVFSDEGCLDTTNHLITVNPNIEADFSSIDQGCHPLAVSFTNLSTPNVNSSWTFGDGGLSNTTSPSHTFINNSDTTAEFVTQLLVTNSFGCQDSINDTIHVFPKPKINLTLDTNRGCHPHTVNYTDASINADSCRWVFGDGVVEDSCFKNYAKVYQNTTSSSPINYNTRLFVFSNEGCLDTTNYTIIVNPDIQASFTVGDSACTPYNASFVNQSTGVDNYTWQFGDGAASTVRNPTHFYFNATDRDTIFRAALSVSNIYGCEDTASQLVTVHPKPLADFVTNVNGGCHPLAVQMTNQSELADSCFWNLDDGTTVDSCGPVINHVYTNQLSLVPIDYFPQLIVMTNNNCSDTLSRQISVNPEVIADFSADTIGCSPLVSTLRSQSSGAINYLWDFGDGGIGSGIITGHTFTNTSGSDQTFQVQLTAQSLYGCDDAITKNVTVLATPRPNFTATPAFQVFPDATVNFNNTTPNPGSWTYEWDFGDTSGSNLGNPGSHTYQRWGTFAIQLKASGAVCEDSITKTIEIDVPIPVVEFSDSASGCSPLEVSFMNESLYGANFEWDFGDGGASTAEHPTYTYLREGEYNVTLRVQGFAPNKEAVLTKSQYIRVFKSPRAGFFTNKDKVFIPNDPLVFFNTSIDADIYQWDFGDGNASNEENPTHFYTEEGEFQIRLIASSINNCSDTFLLPNLVLAELEGSILVPNAFTPNPNGSSGGLVNPLAGLDALNDVFYAKVAGTVQYELNIFNKWGELLFVSTDPRYGWDGYYKGELCQQDAYVWKIRAGFADGRTVVKTGDLMLLR